MPRYKLILEYDGRDFVGWQRQANGPSVQGALEAAVEALCQCHCLVQGAGRTDSGVHALAQAAHVDLPRALPPDAVRDGLNHHLGPVAVSVLAAEAVADDFDARRSARTRHYRYLISTRRARPSLDRGRVWHRPGTLDSAAMHEAARALIGRHDFSTFRAAQCQANSPLRTLDRLDIRREGDAVICETAARSFLQHQVRSMIGSLAKVGQGRWPPRRIAEILAARDRTACGPVAPPDGLYLVRVDYPD